MLHHFNSHERNIVSPLSVGTRCVLFWGNYDFTVKYENNILKKYIPENHQTLHMEQFNEIVFSKHKNSLFRLARRNTLYMDLLATLMQEIVTHLAKYIWKEINVL